MRRTLHEATQIKYGALIPLSPVEASESVSDPTNWPRFFNSIKLVEVEESWGAPGGRAKMVNGILTQQVVTELALLDWNRPYGFRYLGRNQGRVTWSTTAFSKPSPRARA